MKIYKIFQYAMLFGAALMINACAGEEEDIFDQSAAERLNTSSDKYSSILEGAKGGWVVEYYPTNSNAPTTGEGYLWLVKFFNDQQVLVAMNNQFSNNIYAEDSSAWEVITDNGPVLSFNSYNKNVHTFSDPDVQSIPGDDDNVWGVGVGGDYEFVIVDAPVTKNAAEEPFVMLKGKKRGTYNRMTQLPDTTNFQQYLADVQSFQKSIFSSELVKCYIRLGDYNYVMTNGNTGIAGLYKEGEDALTTTTYHPFLMTKRNGNYYLRFRSSITVSDDSKVQEFVYDADKDIFSSIDNAEFTIEGYSPVRFFEEKLKDKSQWRLLRMQKVRMSDKMYNLMDAFYKKQRTFANITWRMLDDKIYCRITYSSVADYEFSMDIDANANAVTFKYVGPKEDQKNASTIYEKYPELQELLTAFSQKYIVKGTNNNYALNMLHFTSESDPDLWFDLTLN